MLLKVALLVLVLTAGPKAGKHDPPFVEWKSAGKDAETCYVQTRIGGRMRSISVFRYKMWRHTTKIVHAPAELSDSTSALALRDSAIAGLNGSYFNVTTLVPTTYLKVDGERVAGTRESELYRVDGILATNGRRIDIFPCDTADYDNACRRYKSAIASGPVLLKDGKKVKDSWPNTSFYTKYHPRTIVGTDGKGWAYLIVIDGRFAGKGEGSPIAEAVEICQMLELKDAINLDGGGSCALWTAETGVLSHPYDNHRFDHYGQRIVPNIITVK
ncbi:MAG: phosphodiester glycosidase family protein [Bacteroidales bacterium]|nr:phosphodiester glycosidase family protein [Bacteroidales bacterium]